MLVLAPNSDKFTNQAFKINSCSPSAIHGAVEELLPYSASDRVRSWLQLVSVQGLYVLPVTATLFPSASVSSHIP